MISTILFEFSFSGIAHLMILFLKSINASLILFTNVLFLALNKSLGKNNGLRFLKFFENDSLSIYFSSVSIH